MKDLFIRNHSAILAIAALALFVLAAFLVPRHTVPHFSTADFLAAKTFWKGEVHRLGGTAAYKEFLSSAPGEDADSMHISAHAVGAALFEELGDAGLSYCDPSFGFGCYHGFFLGALGAEGESHVGTLYDVCVKAYGILGTGCQHGIGHGIMEYVGYDQVPRALELCASLAPQPTSLLGCTSGVFMEYFWPLGTESLPSSRAIEDAHPYAPCPDVPAAFQNSCYFELGSRYVDLPGTDYYALCGSLSDIPRRYCFEGAGYRKSAGETSATPAPACETSPTPEDVVNCRAGAAWDRFSEGHPESVRAACADPSVPREQECLLHADLTEGKDPNFPKPYDEN